LLGDGPPITIVTTPGSYRIVYQTALNTGGFDVVNTETLGVRRPFDSRKITRSGPPPGGALLDDQISTLTRIALQPVNSPRSILLVSAGMAPFDIRLEASLEPLLKQGALERRERRRVVSRDCQIYRSSGTLDSTTITPLVSGSTSNIDTCIDADGLVLEQVRYEGDIIRARLIALSVTEDVTFPDNEFAVEATGTVPPSQGGGLATQIDPTSPTIAVSFALRSPPAGFSLVGRYATASPEQVDALSGKSSGRVASVFDVYQRGPDFVTVENGGTSDFSTPFAASPLGSPVDLGAKGQGEVVPGTRGSEVRVLLRGSRYLRVAGTLSPDELVAIARQTVPAPQP
jgi:hypothetical protein